MGDSTAIFTAARGAGTLSGPAKALSVGAMESIRVAVMEFVEPWENFVCLAGQARTSH